MATTTTSLPALPADVVAFAAEKGVVDYLPGVLEMTRQVFPNCPITPILEDDPEIADWRKIVFDVDVTWMDEDQMFAAQRQWTAAIFRCCPATHVHFFTYGLRATS